MTSSFFEYRSHAQHFLLASGTEQQVTYTVKKYNIREPTFLLDAQHKFSYERINIKGREKGYRERSFALFTERYLRLDFS